MKIVKRFCAIVICIFIQLPSYSQVLEDTLFVDQHGATIEKAKASFYRILKIIDSNDIEVTEYYLKNTIHFIGHFRSRNANIKQGKFLYYNLDGHKSSEGKYTNGFKDGEWIYYFDEGRKIKERELFAYPKKGYYSIEYDLKTYGKSKEGWIDQFDKKTGLWLEYFSDSDSIKLKTIYEAGLKMGEQLEFYPNGKLKRREKFNKSKVEKGEMYDEYGKSVKYYPAFIYPEPPEYLTKYIDVRVKCFKDLIRKTDISYKLRVLKDGSVSEVELPDLPESECKKEIIQVLLKMRKWKPARSEDKPINLNTEGILKYRLHNE